MAYSIFLPDKMSVCGVQTFRGRSVFQPKSTWGRGNRKIRHHKAFQTSYISELSKRTCFSLDFYVILQRNASLQHPCEAAEKTNIQPTEMNFKAQLYTEKLSGLGAVLGLAKISLDGKTSLNLVNSMKCSFERQQTTSLKFSQFGLPESVSLFPHQPLSKY